MYKTLALIGVLLLSSCSLLNIESKAQYLARFKGQDKEYLIKEEGFPASKENHKSGEVWLYENINSSVFDEIETVHLTASDEDGYIQEKTTKWQPAYIRHEAEYKLFFIDLNGLITDITYKYKAVDLPIEIKSRQETILYR